MTLHEPPGRSRGEFRSASARRYPSEPLLSPDWYRVAELRLRLRSGVSVSRQQVRGEFWFVVTDPVSGRHHRFNAVAWALIGACDGASTLDEIWSDRVAAAGDAAPSQGEAIRLVAEAFAASLLAGDIAPDAAAVVKRHAGTRLRRRRAQVNPLSLRVKLWDADAFLSAHVHRVAWLFSGLARAGTVALIALGALLLGLHTGEIGSFAERELGSGRMLLLMWLAYPFVKALHELAHAFAVKVHGGEVHEIGVTLLLLTPLPYVDASASLGFADKRRRIDVAAAGIAVELLLSTLALMLWLLLEPGLARDLAFAVVFVGALSTLAVNANPLLRFDGYHVLCDAAELPNLAPRSSRYWQFLLKRRLLGLTHMRFGSLARGEWPWLVAYAPLSWLYRALLLVLLALVVAEWSAVVGLAVLALAGWLMVGKPALAALRWLTGSAEARGHRPRAAFTAAVVLGLVAFAGFALPLPQRSHAPGVVWLPDDAMVRLGAEGFVEAFLAADGAVVEPGTPIARLGNEALQLELVAVLARLERQQVERVVGFDSQAQRVGAADDELARLLAEAERLHQRVDALTVRSRIQGRLVIDPSRTVVGQYVLQGELLAQVLPSGAPLVRTLVRNDDIALVRQRPGRIGVQLAHGGGRELAAVVATAVPQASTRLPSAALGEAGGGSIALDSTDASGRTAREPRFQFDLALVAGTDTRVGERALVTFHHGDASAAELIGRFLRQSFLRHFER